MNALRERVELPEGGAALAQRRRGTGWRHVAEPSEAETDAGVMTGGRIVVGEPTRSLSARTYYEHRSAVLPIPSFFEVCSVRDKT